MLSSNSSPFSSPLERRRFAKAILTGRTGDVESVGWRPDSRQLLSAGSGTTTCLWDTEARRPLWKLVVLPDKQTIKSSPKGHMLASDPAVFERECRYIVEQPSGAMEIVAPEDFEPHSTKSHQLTQAGKQAGSSCGGDAAPAMTCSPDSTSPTPKQPPAD